jgi:predicted AlkP superfamily phosphohydrolase/phosphomutase
MPKVLIIGLDGATWQLFAPWASAGRMPHLAALMDRGTWGPLRSTIPPLTLPAWSSLVTGKNPGGHGVYAFWRLGSRRYEPGPIANASDVRTATIWEIAGHADRRVGVVNVPPSYPIRKVNGFVVGCMLTPPGERFTDPPELQAELGDYTIDVRAPAGLRSDPAAFAAKGIGFLEALKGQTRRRADAVVDLMRRRPIDLLGVVFYAPDRVQHFFWEFLGDAPPSGDEARRMREACDAVYAELDAGIGRMVAAAGPDATVIVASDHGFTSSPRQSIRINRWLADEGLLHPRPLWHLRRKIAKRALPAGWRTGLDRMERTINPARTKAWAERIETTTAAIWVHAAGRYPLGCVAPGTEYEAVRTRIIEGLGGLRDAAGRPVFRAAYRREDLYSGPFVEEAPDVVAVCDERYGLVYQSLRRDLRSRELFGPWHELGYSGTHSPQGIYLLAGPPVQALGEHREYPIESIAPTALHLLDLPVPSSMEGPVLESALREDYRRDHPVRIGADTVGGVSAPAGWRSDDDEAKVADHLRALGYLE